MKVTIECILIYIFIGLFAWGAGLLHARWIICRLVKEEKKKQHCKTSFYEWSKLFDVHPWGTDGHHGSVSITREEFFILLKSDVVGIEIDREHQKSS